MLDLLGQSIKKPGDLAESCQPHWLELGQLGLRAATNSAWIRSEGSSESPKQMHDRKVARHQTARLINRAGRCAVTRIVDKMLPPHRLHWMQFRDTYFSYDGVFYGDELRADDPMLHAALVDENGAMFSTRTANYESLLNKANQIQIKSSKVFSKHQRLKDRGKSLKERHHDKDTAASFELTRAYDDAGEAEKELEFLYDEVVAELDERDSSMFEECVAKHEEHFEKFVATRDAALDEGERELEAHLSKDEAQLSQSVDVNSAGLDARIEQEDARLRAERDQLKAAYDDAEQQLEAEIESLYAELEKAKKWRARDDESLAEIWALLQSL